MFKPRFYHCKKCGNTMGLIEDGGVQVMCCGEPMEELQANTVDAAQEKHVPVATVNGNIVEVNVGSVDHPMLEEHHIEWIYLLSEEGGQRKPLKVGGAPHATFALTETDKPLEVYEYCNLHGLWMAKI